MSEKPVFTKTALSIWVDIGQCCCVRKSKRIEDGKGWEDARIHILEKRCLSPSMAEEKIRDLQRAIEVARKLDEDPSWRGE